MNVITNDKNSKNINFDINIVPIIDCFTVLITFLLISVQYIALGYFDVAPAIPSEGATLPKKDSLELNAFVMHDKTLLITIKAKETTTIKVENKNGYALGEFYAALQIIEKENPELVNKEPWITLNAENTMNYEYVIQAIEAFKEKKYQVLLGGFT